jgi:hypothetical protein
MSDAIWWPSPNGWLSKGRIKKKHLIAENAQLREQYIEACVNVARMHEAAVGYVGSPVFGVVEDVWTLRTLAEDVVKAFGPVPRDGSTEAQRADREFSLMVLKNWLKDASDYWGTPPIVPSHTSLGRHDHD